MSIPVSRTCVWEYHHLTSQSSYDWTSVPCVTILKRPLSLIILKNNQRSADQCVGQSLMNMLLLAVTLSPERAPQEEQEASGSHLWFGRRDAVIMTSNPAEYGAPVWAVKELLKLMKNALPKMGEHTRGYIQGIMQLVQGTAARLIDPHILLEILDTLKVWIMDSNVAHSKLSLPALFS